MRETVPVSALRALRINVPAPLLVMPPVVSERSGTAIVKLSPAPSVRKTRSAVPPLVRPVAVPALAKKAVVPPETKMPPAVDASPFCKVRI